MLFNKLVFKRCVCKLVIVCYLFVTQQIMPFAIVAGIVGFSTASVSRAADISFVPGLNLFSYPIRLPENGLNCIDLKTDLGIEQLKRLGSLDQLFHVCQENDFLIEPGEGYVVRVAENLRVSLEGENDCPAINIAPGLNLIGVPTPQLDLGCFDLLRNLGDESSVASIQYFDKQQGRFVSCAYDPLMQNSQPQGTDFPIRSGEAFLVSSHVTINNINLNDLDQCQPVIENRPPRLDSIGSKTIVPGQTLRMNLTASDLDGDSLHFTSSTLPLPENAGMNALTGVFTFTPAGDQVGVFELTFIVSDDILSDQETITITVQQPDPNAPTQLSGRLLDTNDFVLNEGLETPIVGATVSLLDTGISTISDANGFFTLTNSLAGQQILDIDSSTAQSGPNGAIYAGFRERILLIENISNIIERPIYLPRIDASSLTTVSPESITTVENIALGIELTVPAHTAKNSDGTDFSGNLSISIVPDGLAPAALPETVAPALLITLQPVGVSFSEPVKITFPNSDRLPPGSEVDLWSLNPDSGVFTVVGIGRVILDGSAIEIIEGGVRANDWHYILPLPAEQKADPDQDNKGNLDPNCCVASSGSSTGNSNVANDVGGAVDTGGALGVAGASGSAASLNAGASFGTDVSSGNLSRGHNLGSHRSLGKKQGLRLRYNSNYADPQPIISSVSVLDSRAIIPEHISSTLELGGISQGTEIFTDVSSLDIEVDYRQVIQIDASEIKTGFYPYILTQTSHYTQSSVASTLRGNILINNQSQSTLGAGWTLDGFNRLHVNGSGSLVLAQGDGRTQVFTQTVSPSSFESPVNFPVEGTEFSNPDSAGTGDFNEDGHLDFVMTNRDRSEISLFMADTNGGFLPASQVLIGAILDTRGTKGLTVADFNNDMHLDIAVSLKGESQDVSINLGDGSGNFAVPSFLASALTTKPTGQIESADLNRDGNIDLVFSQSKNSLSTWLGDGNGGFQEGTLLVGPSCSCTNRITIADFDNDAIPDIASNGSVLRVYFGDGGGGFESADRRELITTGQSGSSAMAVGDIDQDGNIDLISTSYFGTKGTFVYFSDGQRRFSDPVKVFTTDQAVTGVAVGDVNEDGALDIITTTSGDGKVIVNTGNGVGSFARPVRFPTNCFVPVGVILDHINNDSHLDMLLNCLDRPGSADVFINTPGVEKTFAGPAGEFSHIIQQSSGQFEHQLKNGTRFLFDSSGLQTSVVDRNDNTTAYSYDANERLKGIIDPVGLQTTLTYTAGLLSSVIEPDGSTTILNHDSSGNLINITDPDSSTRQFLYDPQHLLLSQISKRGLATNYRYDFAGRNIQAVRPDGGVVSVIPAQTIGLVDPDGEFGSQNNPAPLITVEPVFSPYTDANNNITHYKTTGFGTPAEIVDPLGEILVINRDEEDNPTQIMAHNGAVTEMSYDNVGNLLTRKEAVGTPLERQTEFSYEPVFNQLTQSVNVNGNITRFEYDAHGNLLKIIDALGNDENFTYNNQGLLLSQEDKSGNITTFTYNNVGNISTIINAEGHETRFSYDDAGNVLSRIDGFGTPEVITNSFTYDMHRRLLTRTDGVGAVTQFNYDQQGNLLETMIATGQMIKRGYDELNRLIFIEDPVTGISRFDYDLNSNLIKTTNALNQSTHYAYDAVNQLIQTTDALGHTEHFNYDVQGNLVSFQNADDQLTHFVYDLLDRKTEQVNLLGLKTLLTYDKRNNLISKKDPKEQLVTHSYDALSRRIQTVTTDDLLQYSYDDSSNLLSATDNDSSLVFSYDSLNRIVTTQALNDGLQPAVLLTNQYDSQNNRTQLDNSAGGTTQFSFDQANRLINLVTPAGDTIEESYDLAGRILEISRPNTVDSEYAYDAKGRTSSITHDLASFNMSYNAVGNIITISELLQTRHINYDALQQVTVAGTANVPESYSYDAIGNRLTSHLSASHLYNQGNHLLNDDQFSYTYDDNGNLITKTAKLDSAVTTYSYDTFNRLTQIDLPSGVVAKYRYDAFGRRIEKDIDGEITRYVYDAENILLEYDGNNALLARYSYGQKIDQPLSMERDNQSYFYQTDHLGSIRKIVDINGNQVNNHDYDAFGRIESSVEGVMNPYAFTGRELDTESGLYFYRSRYYDPRMGKFLTEDPIGFRSGDSNFYRYVGNNPLNFIDPSGEIFISLAVAAVGLSLTAVAVAPFISKVAERGEAFAALAESLGGSLCESQKQAQRLENANKELALAGRATGLGLDIAGSSDPLQTAASAAVKGIVGASKAIDNFFASGNSNK